MKQIPYGGEAIPLHFDFPSEWNPAEIASILLTIKDRDGNILVDEDDQVTLWTSVTTDGAITRYSNTLTLNNISEAVPPSTPAVPPDALKANDMILISGSGGVERHRIKDYSAATKTATIERIFENAHDDGDDVYGLFADYELDASDADDFYAGVVLTLIWAPLDADDAPIYTPAIEQLQVATSSLDIGGLEKRFSRVYPRAYDAFKVPIDRFADMAEEAEIQITQELLAEQPPIDIQRIVDKNSIATVVMARMAYLWTLNGDENKSVNGSSMADERAILGSEYEKQIGYLKKAKIWTDENQDLVEDEDEATSHEPIFGRGW